MYAKLSVTGEMDNLKFYLYSVGTDQLKSCYCFYTVKSEQLT